MSSHKKPNPNIVLAEMVIYAFILVLFLINYVPLGLR